MAPLVGTGNVGRLTETRHGLKKLISAMGPLLNPLQGDGQFHLPLIRWGISDAGTTIHRTGEEISGVTMPPPMYGPKWPLSEVRPDRMRLLFR